MTSVQFNIRENLRDTLAKFEQATKRDIEQALPRALNRTLTTVRAESARRMRGVYPGLKAAVIKRQMKFKRATRAAPTAVVTFSGKRFRLFGNFNVRTRLYAKGTGIAQGARLPPNLQTGDGKPVSGEDLRRVFLQRSTTTGTPNFWLRVGRERTPITVVVVRGLAATFVEEKLGEALTPVARARFIAALTQELKFRTANG